MKLLIFTPYIPYPINSGGNRYVFTLIDHIRKFVDVSIALTTKFSGIENVASLQKLWPNVKFFVYDEKNEININIESPKYYKFLLKMKASIGRKLVRQVVERGENYALRRNSSIYTDFYEPLSKGYLNFVSSIFENNSFDLVQVEFFDLLSLTNVIPKSVKKIFIHHELRYVKNEREYAALTTPNVNDLYLKEFSKKIEIQHLLSYDAVVTLTGLDKEKLETVLNQSVPVYSSSAIIDIPENSIPETVEFNNNIIFLGGTNHFPNKDGIDWFLNNCWQRIHSQNKNLKLQIIGAWSDKSIIEYTRRYPNIIFTGFVDDLSAELKDAIMIIPIRIGSGIRIKALDAIANGVPIVATSVGVEGLGLADGEGAFVKDTADSFADAVLSLASDNSLFQKFRYNAVKSLTICKKSQDAVNERLNIYRDVLALKDKENN